MIQIVSKDPASCVLFGIFLFICLMFFKNKTIELELDKVLKRFVSSKENRISQSKYKFKIFDFACREVKIMHRVDF